MKDIISTYPEGGASESLELIQKNNPGISGLGLLEVFTESQLAWMTRCVGEDWMQKNEFGKLALEDSELLCNFSYRIAVAGVQSAGKTTVLNTLLDFPYMPAAPVVTTSCSTSVMYGEKPEIEVSSRRGEEKTLISLERLPEDIFREMKSYVVSYLIHHYGATSLDCLMEPYELDDFGKPIVDESMLHMNYSNLRHRAALTLHVLSFYVDQNMESTEQQDLVTRVNEQRVYLLEKLGIPQGMMEYDITFRVNSPLLKDGLVFVDLPGSGAAVGAGNGMASHEEIQQAVMGTCKAVMLLFEPQMTNDSVKPLDDVINFFNERKVEHNRIGTSLIPVLNRMDIPGASGCHTKIDPLFARRGLNFTYSEGMYRISALQAEKRFFDANPDMSVQYSNAAREIGFKPDEDEFKLRDKLRDRAKESKFDALYDYLKNYADASRETICLEVLLNIYRALNDYLEEVHHSLRIKEALLNTFIANAGQLVAMVEQQLKQPFLKQFAVFQACYDTKVAHFIKDTIPDKVPNSQTEFEFLNWVLHLFSKATNSASNADIFLKVVQDEHNQMKNDLETSAKTLTKNWLGDVVLWRDRGLIKEYVQPNYGQYMALRDIVENNKYDRAFNYLYNVITELHHTAQRFSTDMENDLKKDVKALTGTFRRECASLENDIQNQQQYDKATVAAFVSVLKEITAYCEALENSVQEKINALSISETETVNDAMKAAYTAKATAQEKLRKMNTDHFDKIIQTGLLAMHTYIVSRADVDNAITAISKQKVQSKFRTAFDTAGAITASAYRKLFMDKKQKMQNLLTSIQISLDNMITSVTDNLTKNQQTLVTEIQAMKNYLTRVKPSLPSDSGNLGLVDSNALIQWKAIQTEYQKAVSLLESHRQEG